MAWGIFMTFMTLFGMLALAIREASMSEGPSESAHEKTDLPKAA
jgi:hypothetical protein